ncbi:MAG: cupin domain-containing protein [Nitrososphaerales archaeon]
MSSKKTAAMEQTTTELDFSNNYIVHGRFPIYNINDIEKIKPVIDNERMTVRKIPMGVDGQIVWTHLSVTLHPKQFTEPYSTDTDIVIKIMEGSAWMAVLHNNQNAGNIVEPGDMIIIPKNGSYTLMNQSKTDKFMFTIEGNILLQMS